MIAAVFMTSLGSVSPSIGSEHAANRVEYQEFKPLDKLSEPRFWSPLYAYRDDAVFQLDFPSPFAASIGLSETSSPNVRCSIAVRFLGSNSVKHASFPLQFLMQSRRDDALNLYASNRSNVYTRATVSLNDWPDGDAEASLTIEGDDTLKSLVGSLPPQRFRIVRQAFRKVAAEHRDEMAVWLDDANASHLIWGKRPLWPNIAQSLEQPARPFDNLRGFILRSYLNPQLERRQPYTLYVPSTLDLSTPAPLMILLHGSGGDYRNLVADFASGQRFEDHPMLIANAGAYGTLEFRHLALNDVRWVIEDVSRKYKVDPSRVYVQGISLGGRGCLDLAAMMPDTFAAVSAQGVYGVQRELLDPVGMMSMDPVAHGLASRNDIRTWLPNLRHTAVELVYGWNDTSTRPVNALAIEQALGLHGIPVVARGFDSGHDITMPKYNWATTREWLLKQHKDSTPATITFRPVNLRHARSAWIEVEALREYHRPAEVTASIRTDGKLAVTATNIARLRYHPPPAGHPLSATMPSNPMQIIVSPTGSVSFTNNVPPDPKPSKHPRQSGPIWDIWSEPFIYVVDSAVPAADLKRLHASAQISARSDVMVAPHRYTVKSDRDLTETELAARNIIWFTTRSSTNARRRLMPLPLPSIPVLDTEPATGLVTLAIRPSPWSDNHCVLIVENNTEHVIPLQALGFWQQMFQADWLVQEPQPEQQRLRLRAAGSYDHHWNPTSHTTQDFQTTPITR
jgi:predicted esterase